MTQDTSSAAYDPVAAGQVAGYQIEAEIGRGGMAVVYRALDVKLGRPVALKVLAPRLAQDESFRRRFMQESRAAAAVDHPHIVPVFEAGEAQGCLFIAMRYVGTGDVRTLLERVRVLPVARAVRITAQVASALDAAHARGLVHRDVKPANMLLAGPADGGADHVYLSDFGLSKQSLAPLGLTSTGQFLGTLDYVAPEQIEGRQVDGRADLYALACATVEMLTGAPPFRRTENLALMWAQLSEPPPLPSERRAELPRGIDQVITQALAKSPDGRYRTCMDFAAALRAASAIQGGAAGGRAGARPAGAWPAGGAAAAARPVAGAAAAAPPAGGAAGDVGAAILAAGTPAAGLAGQRAGRPPTELAYRPTPTPTSADPAPTASPTSTDLSDRAGFSEPASFLDPPDFSDRSGFAGRSDFSGISGPLWRSDPPAPVGPSGGPVQPSMPTRQAPPRPRQRRGRGRKGLAVAAAAAVVVVLCLAGLGYKLLHRNTVAGSPATTTSAGAATRPVTVPVISPAQTVQAYFRAINRHRYARAWQLGGKNTGVSYASFVSGFSGTAHDAVRILSASGVVVTAHLTATQTDGSVQTYQGTYTVSHGAIASSDVHPTN